MSGPKQGQVERWSLPQTLTWIATGKEIAQTDEFDLATCKQAWPALAAVLAAERLQGIGSKVGKAIKYASVGFTMQQAVKTIKSGLRFPPPASPGFPLTAQLISRTDQKGKAWLDVLDAEQLSRMRRTITMHNEQWWSDISFLRGDILSEFPANPTQSNASDNFYELPANEPPRGRQSKDAYHALKKEYGTQIPKIYSLQQLADNLQKSGHGVHSRESVARALGRKK
jgi:hypothetical protein